VAIVLNLVQKESSLVLYYVAVVQFGIIAAVYSIQHLCSINCLRSINRGTDTVLVTGASSGMGLVTALFLCDNIGFQVFATVRKSEDGDKIMNMVKNKDRMKILLLDITKQDTIDKAVETVSQTVGSNGLYGLFNNAGTSPKGMFPLEYTDIEECKWLFDVNTIGPLRVTNGFLPLLRKAKGTIVNNTSVAGFVAAPFWQPYSFTKFALESISDSQRRELRSSGVRVVVLECGLINSSLMNHTWPEKKKVEQLLPKIRKNYPNWLFEINHDRTLKFAKNGESAEVVARIVDKSFRGTNPKTRYVVGGLTWYSLLISNFSDKTIDTIMGMQQCDPETKIDLDPPHNLHSVFQDDPFYKKYNYNKKLNDNENLDEKNLDEKKVEKATLIEQ